MKRFNHQSIKREHSKMDTEFGNEFVEFSKQATKRPGNSRVGGRVNEKLNEVSEALLMSQLSNRQ